MKKLLVTLLFIPLFAHLVQNFNIVKIKLNQLYKSNPEKSISYRGCEFLWTSKKGIFGFSKCVFESRKNELRVSRIEWKHVMPAKNLGRHL